MQNSGEPISNRRPVVSIQNPQVRTYRFLEGMYRDGYFPDHIVDKGHAVLLRLCGRIETEHPADLAALYALTDVATEEFNRLQDDFAAAESESETVAREVICLDFRFIAAAYGFADADPELLVGERDW